jgi:hypothetical protein
VNFLSTSRNFFEITDAVELSECSGTDSDFIDLKIEIGLLLLHEVDKLVLLLIEGSDLATDAGLGLVGRTKEAPLFVIVFFVAELVLELFEDGVDLHADLDLDVKLFNL